MLLDATVIGEGYRVLVFLFWWVLLCAFFFLHGGWGFACLGWSFKSLGCHHLILLRGRVSLGVFWWSSIPLAGGRMLGQGLGRGALGKVFLWGRVVDSEGCK